MAMRNYGVETKGVVLTTNEMVELLSLNKENIENKFVLEDFWKEVFENIDNIEISDIIDFTYNIDYATFIGEFEGYLEVDRTQERTYFSGDDIIILELKKYHNLYKKYENRDEIIEELKETLSKVGIKVDEEYIEEHYGYICGSYYA